MELLAYLQANPQAFAGVEGAETVIKNLVEVAKKANINLLANDVTDPQKPTYMPKARFDEVTSTKNTLLEQVKTLDGQLVELKKAAAGNEEMLTKIKNFETENKTLGDKLKATRLDAAIEIACIGAKAKNPKLVKALLDNTKLQLVETGDQVQVVGLTEQLAAIQKDNDYLFGPADQTVGGPGPNGPNQPHTGPNPWAKETLNLTKQAELLKSNPAQAEQLKAAAGVK